MAMNPRRRPCGGALSHDASTRRQTLGLLGALALGPAWGAALAQAPAPFPTRPITLWLPWPAGGATDLTFRVLAEAASRKLGQKVLIENRGGAGGTLAMPVLILPSVQVNVRAGKLPAPEGNGVSYLKIPINAL